MDISGFFDSIDHRKLEEEWCSVMGVLRLPKDHLAVFQSVTHWSEVDRQDCYTRLGITNAQKAPRPLCVNAREFRDKVKGRATGQESLVKVNKNKYGIPQGTPISAHLSNIYMITFDLSMRELEVKIGGYYRRYSDDILWVCDRKYAEKIKKFVDASLEERGEQLKRKEEKTEISFFTIQNNKQKTDRPFQYLGFTFDGRKSLLRSQTLARYWRRLIYAARSAKREARKAKKVGGNPKVFRKKLNHALTHLGKGNFVTSYAYRAQEKMGGKAIRRQLSGHMRRVNKEIAGVKKSVD